MGDTMKKYIVKIAVLGMLVILCIWQIVTLWLGEMPSHSFFVGLEEEKYTACVQPKAIWVNVGKLAYKIEEVNTEYAILINELRSLVNSKVRASEIKKVQDMTYEKLLGMQGILYEYALGLSIEELVGSNMKDLADYDLIRQVFVDMSTSNDHETNLYLVGEDIEKIYEVTLYDTLEGHQKMMKWFNHSEYTNSLVGYQASITSNKSQYIKGNNFFPLSAKEAPLEYEVLSISSPFEGLSEKEAEEKLEGYVNAFFANPLLKSVDEGTDGSVIFSENMKTYVKYSPAGTLEFKSTVESSNAKLTSVERLNKVMDFVQKCKGIPEFLKEGLFLSSVTKNTQGEYSYGFDYKYKGFGVHLTNDTKSKLGIGHILELTVKEGQIISGKWSILNIGPYDEVSPVKDQLKRSFGEVVDTMYEKYVKKEYEEQKLDVVQCRYIMSSIEGRMTLDWVVSYQNKWYYP